MDSHLTGAPSPLGEADELLSVHRVCGSGGRGRVGLLFLLLLILLSACSGQSGKLRISGEMKGVNEDNYLIVSADGGLDCVDTLHIKQGEFSYQCDLDGDATYHIIFSNMTDLMVWGHSGDALTMKGNTEELRNVKVEGNKENELYTKFRLKINALTDQDSIRDAAHQFIIDNTKSPVAVEVYRQYYFDDKQAESKDVESLLNLLKTKQPNNQQLLSYTNVLKKKTALQKGKRLPDFNLTDTDGKKHKLADYKGRYLMLIFWAGWQSTSNPAFFHLQQMEDEGKSNNLSVLTVNMDIEKDMIKSLLPDMQWPTVADMKGWDSPYAEKLGIRNLPYFIFVDTQGKIIATGTNYNNDIMPEVDKNLTH